MNCDQQLRTSLTLDDTDSTVIVFFYHWRESKWKIFLGYLKCLHKKQGLKTSSCECASASREDSESYWCMCMLKCDVTQWLSEWQIVVKAWVAICN